MTFLGSPVLPSRAMDRVLQGKIDDLRRAIKRLALLQEHDALCLLKNLIAMPKLLYVLRTSPCFDNPLLDIFDDILRRGLSLELNVELSDKQWDQANLPVHMSGLGVRSAGMLASSAFLDSTAAMLPLQGVILSKSVHGEEDPAVRSPILVWILGVFTEHDPRQRTKAHSKSLGQSGDSICLPEASCGSTQNTNRCSQAQGGVLRTCRRLAPCRANHRHRLGSTTCQSHTCICGVAVNANGSHELSAGEVIRVQFVTHS